MKLGIFELPTLVEAFGLCHVCRQGQRCTTFFSGGLGVAIVRTRGHAIEREPPTSVGDRVQPSDSGFESHATWPRGPAVSDTSYTEGNRNHGQEVIHLIAPEQVTD